MARDPGSASESCRRPVHPVDSASRSCSFGHQTETGIQRFDLYDEVQAAQVQGAWSEADVASGFAEHLKWQCKCITIETEHPSRSYAMPAIMQLESTLTDRYQTTVPESVRRALHLGKRDRIHYTIRPGGEVVLTRATASDGDDPALAPFLGFLARDIAEHPGQLRAVDAGLAQRIKALVGMADVDLDAALSADDE